MVIHWARYIPGQQDFVTSASFRLIGSREGQDGVKMLINMPLENKGHARSITTLLQVLIRPLSICID